MSKNGRSSLLFFAVFLCCFLISSTERVFAVSAFPGAEGFGATASGGRGGSVYIVDSLADTTEAGKTTLRDCVNDTKNYGARTCVFALGGIIELSSDLTISKPNITIAGQTAPGSGITLKSVGANNPITVNASNVIIRYLHMRHGRACVDCRAFRIMEGKGTTETKTVMVDHNSFSWTSDEMIIIWDGATHTSLQWNTFADGFLNPPSGESSNQAKGPNIGGYKSNVEPKDVGGGFHSLINNLIANMHQRNPRIRATGGVVDVINNVIYNPGEAGSHVTDKAKANFIGNYIKSGPNTKSGINYITSDGTESLYAADNKIEKYHDGGISGIADDTLLTAPNPSDGLAATQVSSADEAYQQVLAHAGASAYVNCAGSFVTRRDAIDQELLREINSNTGRIKSSYADTMGFQSQDHGTPCTDADKDGMPDTFEQAKGLNPNDASDGKAVVGGGYTNLELYLNGTDAPFSSPDPTPTPPTPSPTAPTTPLTADIAPLGNPNGKVDIFDYNLLLEQFGKTGATGFHPADIIKNGAVDIFDYNVLLQQFSP